MKSLEEIKKLVREGKVIIGKERTMKELAKGGLKEILLSSNCPEEFVKDFEYYSKIAGIKVTKLSIPNDELGIICKKPFSISVLGIKNE